MTRCAVISCVQNEGAGRAENRPTFPLPKNPKLREEWLNLINLKLSKSIDCDKTFRVCSRHFPERDIVCKTDKDGRIKKRHLKPNAIPMNNLYGRGIITGFKPRRTRTAVKALTELEVPEPETKVLGRSTEENYVAYNIKSDNNRRQRVLMPIQGDHYRAPRFERINKQTDIQREEMFEEPKPNLEVQIRQLEIDNQKLVEVSLMVDKIVYKDQEKCKFNNKNQDLELDVYEETPSWQVNKHDLEAFKSDHCYIGKSHHFKKLPDIKNVSNPYLDPQETLALKVYLLEVENCSLTKNLRALEKDYVLAMKSKVSSR